MGYGDDIMATAQARALFMETGKKAVFGAGPDRYWSPLFQGHPYIAQPGEPGKTIDNYPGRRPYVRRETKRRMAFEKRFRADPGHLEIELQPCLSEPYVVVEPHVKGKYSADNKDWGWEKWQALVNLLSKKIAIVQFEYGHAKHLDNVHVVATPSIIDALAALKGADRFYGTDGALHHGAAAFGKPATVVWGGYSPPEVLGYDFHRNIGGGWCGARRRCRHCRRAMEKISVEEVLGDCTKVERLPLGRPLRWRP
jgi:ADP-heptose:LPS heptosyltransferase